MSDELQLIGPQQLRDEPTHWTVTTRQALADGPIIRTLRDEITTPTGDSMRRDFVDHPGAVGIVALDAEGCVVVLHQYRHPVGMKLVELPAGILDVAEEAPLAAAQRELAEETRLAAGQWSVLIDLMTTPGSCSESVRVYLARDLRAAASPEGFELSGEEADMRLGRARLADLLDAIWAGAVQNPLLVAGCLALSAVGGDYERLRPADAPWQAREELRGVRQAAPESPAGTDTQDR